MGVISDYVNVSVTITDFTLKRTGFGTPLILVEHGKTYARTATYSKASELLTAGFSATSTAYLRAVELTSQDRKPPTFKVGRKYANANSIQTITFAPDSTAYTGTWTLTFDGATTSSMASNITATALKSALFSLSSVTSLTVTGTMTTGFEIEFTGADGNTAQNVVTVSTTALLTTAATTVTGVVTQTQYGSATEGWSTCLNAVIAEDPDWFMLIAPEATTVSDQTAMATIIETEVKMYGITSYDSAMVTADTAAASTAAKLAASDLDHTFVLYSEQTGSYSVAAWAGLMLPKDPGSSTWAFKSLTGITADSLTTGEKTYILGHNASYYEAVAGRNITYEGQVGSGEYIDVIRGALWIQTTIQENVFLLFANNDKVPFTSAGAAAIEAEIRSVLERAVDRGILVDGTIEIEMPNVDDVDATEKANRQYNDIEFSAQLAGAIHYAGITGTLSV